MERATVAALLRPHRTADTREADHLRAMLSLLEIEGDPFSREHYVPGHFTASAFVLSPRRELLLVHHKKLGRWLQPGGHLEPGDADLLAAARREVVEETGLDEGMLLVRGVAPLDLDVHWIPARGEVVGHRHFDVRFRFEAPRRALVGNNEVVSCRWVPVAEVGEMCDDESVRRVLGKLLG
jgi:8-oxo-dGTP pyrophosphatase MutT (NUDIX family)